MKYLTYRQNWSDVVHNGQKSPKWPKAFAKVSKSAMMIENFASKRAEDVDCLLSERAKRVGIFISNRVDRLV